MSNADRLAELIALYSLTMTPGQARAQAARDLQYEVDERKAIQNER